MSREPNTPEEQLDRFRDFSKELGKLRFTGHSADGLISAQSIITGLVISLDINPRAFRKVDSKALASSILQAMTDAQRQSSEAHVDGMRDIVGVDSFQEMLRGMREFTDRMADEVGSIRPDGGGANRLSRTGSVLRGRQEPLNDRDAAFERLDRLREFNREMSDRGLEGVSSDGMVTAQATVDGRIVGLDLDPRVFRRPEGQALGAAVLEALGNAQRNATKARLAGLNDITGATPVDPEELLGGLQEFTDRMVGDLDTRRHG